MPAICPRCHTGVPAQNVNMQAMTALCPSCNDLFAITPKKFEGTVYPVGIPHRFRIAEGGGPDLHVSWSWWRWPYVFLILFCIAWDSFLVSWYAMALFGTKSASGGHLFAILFPIGHVAVGVGLTYFVIAALFNRTRISCDGLQLHLMHGPIPWKGGRRIEVHRLSDPSVALDANTRGMATLHAVIDGRDVALVKHLDQREAQWLCQEIARRLPR